MGSKIRLPSGVEEGSITALRFKALNPIDSIADLLSGDVEPFWSIQKTAVEFLKFYHDFDWEALGFPWAYFERDFVHWWNNYSFPDFHGCSDNVLLAEDKYSFTPAIDLIRGYESPRQVLRSFCGHLSGPVYTIARSLEELLCGNVTEFNIAIDRWHGRGWMYYEHAENIPAWKIRERERFRSGLYEDVPWSGTLPPIEGHYVHLAMGEKNKGLVSYTQTERKGESDIQTPIRAGAYLTKFYPDLTGDEVREWVTKLDLGQPVFFAKTADEFEEVYTTGPSSCMSKPLSEYESPIHPVRVYAGHDLELAYLKSPDGTPSARALVWPAKKKVGRIYGDIHRLANKLTSLGYEVDTSDWGALEGAKISRIEYRRNCLVMPYIDGCNSFNDHGSFCTIGGPYDAEYTNGLAPLETRGEYCEYYEEHRDEEQYEVYISEYSTQMWSESAFDNHGYRCEASDRYYSDDVPCTEVRTRHGFETWADYHLDNAFFCDFTNTWYSCDNYDFITVASGDTGEANYVHENYTQCSVDNEWYPNDEMIELPNGLFVHTSNHDDSEETAQAAA